jgi:hypothetical protein
LQRLILTIAALALLMLSLVTAAPSFETADLQTAVVISLTTNESCVVGFSSQNVEIGKMDWMFSDLTGKNHEISIKVEPGKDYRWYFRAINTTTGQESAPLVISYPYKG